MIEHLGFYLLAIPVVVLVGMSKGGFGGGLGMLAVPVLSLLIDPRLAAAIMLPILCLMDLVSIWTYRWTWDNANVKILLPGALVGITAGAMTFQYVNADVMRLLVGVMALYFVGIFVWNQRKIDRLHDLPVEPSYIGGGFWGTLAGYVSYIAHAGGPPISIYLLPQRLPRTVFVGTTVLFFTVVNYVKLIPYIGFGQVNGGSLVSSLILLPLAPLGVLIGFYLHQRISDKWFYNLCYVLLFGAGIKLLAEATKQLFF